MKYLTILTLPLQVLLGSANNLVGNNSEIMYDFQHKELFVGVCVVEVDSNLFESYA